MLSLCKASWEILYVHHLIPWRQHWHFWGITGLAGDTGFGNCWWQPAEEVALGRGEMLPVPHSVSPSFAPALIQTSSWIGACGFPSRSVDFPSGKWEMCRSNLPSTIPKSKSSANQVFHRPIWWQSCLERMEGFIYGMNLHFTEEMSVCLITLQPHQESYLMYRMVPMACLIVTSQTHWASKVLAKTLWTCSNSHFSWWWGNSVRSRPGPRQVLAAIVNVVPTIST